MKFRLLWLVLVTLAAGEGKAREWKDNQGRALQAEMLGVELNKAVVQLPGKQRALLPLSGLSPAQRRRAVGYAFDQILFQQATAPGLRDGGGAVVRAGELSTDGGDDVGVSTGIRGT